ncbi:NAD(P)-dependent oxidoreductase [Pseudooceanicola nanhaiensis]|uniref:NAD(P)-dependent oxidoreductase n=1 Tax=Pseudooceanicola nanhaiensis TaxID=375761 RepID=UPI001CD57030|nr:NAD(P)-dependent oxidoreductase [Pseudooceanicola nanhaiensis]MCA0919266.1 glyoxylate reductase (NADP(+)) [Pseudooceanicola nanhaiensis]
MSTAGLLVCNQLSAATGARLEAHPAHPRVITRTEPEAPWELPEGTEVLVTRGNPAWARAPEAAPAAFAGLKWIQVMSAGLDFYPDWLLRACPVSTGRGLTAHQIADYVIAALLRRAKPLDAVALRRGDEGQHRLGTLTGTRLGLVGYGAIGGQIAARARAFGMEIRVLRRREAAPEAGVSFVTEIEALTGWADHLVLAAPLTAATRGLLSRARLMACRPGLHLVNIARGELLDQEALIGALETGTLSYATLDVTVPEPLPKGHPLLAHPKVLVTPHVAWSGLDLEEALWPRLAEGLSAVATGGTPPYLSADLGY